MKRIIIHSAFIRLWSLPSQNCSFPVTHPSLHQTSPNPRCNHRRAWCLHLCRWEDWADSHSKGERYNTHSLKVISGSLLMFYSPRYSVSHDYLFYKWW